jgi:hypothetical protein
MKIIISTVLMALSATSSTAATITQEFTAHLFDSIPTQGSAEISEKWALTPFDYSLGQLSGYQIVISRDITGIWSTSPFRQSYIYYDRYDEIRLVNNNIGMLDSYLTGFNSRWHIDSNGTSNGQVDDLYFTSSFYNIGTFDSPSVIDGSQYNYLDVSLVRGVTIGGYDESYSLDIDYKIQSIYHYTPYSASVPDSAVWISMIFGFGLTGAAMRRTFSHSRAK